MAENAHEAKRCVAAIGNFYGVHLGHQFLLEETKSFAHKLSAEPGVIVFEPHPRRYFNPDTPPFRLTTNETRDELIKSSGVARILKLEFDASLAAKNPEAFVVDILKKKFALAGVLTGADFRFGNKRAGDAPALERLCRSDSIDVKIVEPVTPPGEEKFGSTGVREAIALGDMRRAATILGRPWHIEGTVLKGRELGRTIGFPTANIALGDLIAPRHGVYAVRVRMRESDHAGIANFGTRPTVDNGPQLLEVNIFDFSGNIYGDQIAVQFVDFIREEKKFDGLPALKAQIAADCIVARELLER